MIIEPMTVADAPALYRWIREDQSGELGQFLPFMKNIHSQQDEEQFLVKMLGIETVKMWTIQTDEKVVIGEILWHSYDDQASTVKLGYWIAQPFRRQGYVSLALQTLIHQHHEIATFIIEVAQENIASQQVAKKAGFRFIGVQRNEVGEIESIYEWQRSTAT